MVTTDLGACEWFVWDLRRSNLIDRGQLDQVIGDFLKRFPRAEPPALAEYLVAQGILSQFQVDRLLQGKTQGLVLGPYTLMDALGTGSMGTVYKASSKTDNKWYAVKVLPRRSMWNVRLARRQVRSFEQCRHPGVVPFVDVGTAGGTHYLVWPLVEGESLDKLVQREGKLKPDLAARYAMQAAEALDICHRNNLIHGLVKPSNLLLSGDGQIRILDFGIGTLLCETEGESLVDTMSTANSLTSGLDCCSPESIMEPTKRTPAGDQYSLGCTLYFMLAGRYPFPDGTTVEKMMAHQTKQPTPIKELAPEAADELVEVVERLMQKDPDKRFKDACDVVEALRPLAGELPSAASSTPLPSRASLRSSRLGARSSSAAAANHGDNGHSTPALREPRSAAAVASGDTPSNRPMSKPGLSLREKFLTPVNQHVSTPEPEPPGLTPVHLESPPPPAYIPQPRQQTFEERFGILGFMGVTVVTTLLCLAVLKLLRFF